MSHLVLPHLLVLVEQHLQFERSLYCELFVLNHSLSSVVFKSCSLLRPACGHQPITNPQVTATPFVNIYTAYQQELQGMLDYTTLHIITLTCKCVE